MIETAKGIPEFQENGYLPHKCYEVTLDDIKEKLVDNFPDSKTRQSRFDCFMEFYEELLKNVKSCIRILINGSFVSNEINPYDVDFVIILDGNSLTEDESNYLIEKVIYKKELRKEYDNLKERVKKGEIDYPSLYELGLYEYGCDFFPVLKYYPNQIEYVDYLQRKIYWIKFWGHSREQYPKGFLNLKVNYEED